MNHHNWMEVRSERARERANEQKEICNYLVVNCFGMVHHLIFLPWLSLLCECPPQSALDSEKQDTQAKRDQEERMETTRALFCNNTITVLTHLCCPTHNRRGQRTLWITEGKTNTKTQRERGRKRKNNGSGIKKEPG